MGSKQHSEGKVSGFELGILRSLRRLQVPPSLEDEPGFVGSSRRDSFVAMGRRVKLSCCSRRVCQSSDMWKCSYYSGHFQAHILPLLLGAM